MSKKEVTDKDNENVVEQPIKEENVIEEDKEGKNKNNNKTIFIVIGIAIILLALIFAIFKIVSTINNNDEIKSIKRISKEKYISVECIDLRCSGLIAIKGDKLKKTTIDLYNGEGKKVASYDEIYDSSKKTLNIPNEISDSYFIMRSVNSNNYKTVKYSINNKKGKVVYETENELSVLTDDYILMEYEENGKDLYKILNNKGKEVYSNISDIDSYGDSNYFSIKIEDEYIILNEKIEKVLSGYSVSKSVTDDEDKLLYLVVKDRKNDIYYYYDIKKSEIKGDGFSSYVTSSDNELVITKKENDKNVKYILKVNGKQEKIETDEDKNEIVKNIKEKLDSTKYYLYDESITKKDQKNILVDSKEEKALGILNLESHKFTPLFNYKQDRTYFYSTVSKINDDDNDLYLKISCSSYVCDNQKVLIYDFEHLKEIFKSDSSELLLSEYIQYEDEYKVIRYSSLSANTEYKGKYVLYNKDNKEIFKSSKEIVLLDKKLIFGSDSTSSLVLYSIKNSKSLNNEDTPASVITVKGIKLYKYKDSDDNTIIANLSGKEVIKVSEDDYLTYSDSNIIYLKDSKIYIYDAKKNKTKDYKLKENEKMNDASGDIITPVRGTIFINNSTDKYIKVINSKGNVLKKLKKVELVSVEKNKDKETAFIIVKKTTKTEDLYGIYMAK